MISLQLNLQDNTGFDNHHSSITSNIFNGVLAYISLIITDILNVFEILKFCIILENYCIDYRTSFCIL